MGLRWGTCAKTPHGMLQTTDFGFQRLASAYLSTVDDTYVYDVTLDITSERSARLRRSMLLTSVAGSLLKDGHKSQGPKTQPHYAQFPYEHYPY